MDQSENSHFMFDYIVVGTGPAGAAIAKKLTDDKRTSVLVLEAGDNNSGERPVRDSRFAPPTILTDDYLPEYFWQGKGIPQKHVNDRTFQWTGGRTLGGSSSVNNEQYVRPTPANMKQWEDMLGPLWSPLQETYQFSRMENYNGWTYNPKVRGYGGRLNIRQTPVNPTSMTEKVVSAIERATGFSRIIDYNDPNTPLGPFTQWQLYQIPDGTRESADTAFLSSDMMTQNGDGVHGRRLEVLFQSTALKVIFNHEKRADGIEFLKEGKCFHAHARKKVIISAGINSPQLLMLSGIGPSEMLNEAGIPVVFHNPHVGKNLTTHGIHMATFKTNPDDKPLPDDDPFALYTGGAFLPDPKPGADPNRRGVQMFGQKNGDDKLNIGFYLTDPKGKGSVRIQSDDPLKVVLADEGFLNDPADLESAKNVFRTYMKKIASALENMDSTYQLVSPTVDTIDDDDKLESYLKENLMPTHHIQGTLRMAPDASSGVVDALGQVFGVQDLIVADDSIAPFVSDGNTSAPAFFIGANIADQLIHWQTRNEG